MRERVSVSVSEAWASRVLGDHVGTKSPLLATRPAFLSTSILSRHISVDLKDPLFQRMKDQILAAEQLGERICGAATVTRHYTKRELDAGALYRLLPAARVEFSGVDCGTKYDWNSACPRCGAGRRALGPLMIAVEALDRRMDVQATLDGNEVLISKPLAAALVSHNLSGFNVAPIVDSHTGRVSEDWMQLVVTYQCGSATRQTGFGIDVIHPDTTGRFQCDHHNYMGLRCLTEVTVAHWDHNEDIGHTPDTVGLLDGSVAPHPLLLITSRFREAFILANARGIALEVAHVDGCLRVAGAERLRDAPKRMAQDARGSPT